MILKNYVEIVAQPGVLLQPVFVHRLDPVDLAVPEREVRHGAVDLVVILQRIHLVVFRQGTLEVVLQAVVGRIADAQHVDAVSTQPVAEVPIGVREVRRDEDEVHW